MSISEPKAENLNGIYRNACDLITESHFKGLRFRLFANFSSLMAALAAILLLSGLIWVGPLATSMVQAERSKNPPPPTSSIFIPSNDDGGAFQIVMKKNSIWAPMAIFFGLSLSTAIFLERIKERYFQERDEELKARFLRNPHDDATLIEMKVKWLTSMTKMKSSPLDRKNIQMLGYSPDELLS